MKHPNRKTPLVASLLIGITLLLADSHWPPEARGLRLEVRPAGGTAAAADTSDVMIREGVSCPRGGDSIHDLEEARVRWPDGFTAVYTGLVRLAHPGVYHFQTWGNGIARVEVAGRRLASHDIGDGETAFRSSWNPPSGFAAATFHPVRITFTWSAGGPEPPDLHVQMNKEVWLTKPLPDRIMYPPETNTLRYGVQWILRAVWLPCLILAALELVVMLFRVRRRSRVYFPVAAAAGAVLLFALSLELGLRIAGIAPREYVPGDIWARYRLNRPGETTLFCGYLPNSVKEFEIPLHYNSRGWRDDEHDFEKPSGTYRILVVGDSFVDGKEVEFGKTFHQLLEKELNERRGGEDPAVEVIALARGGIGTEHQIPMIRDEGLRYDPDLVILCFYTGNDVADNSPVLAGIRERWIRDIYTFRVSNVRVDYADRYLIFRNSWVNRHLVDRLLDHISAHAHRYQPGVPEESFLSPDMGVFERGPYDPVWEQAWRRSKGAVLEAREAARSAGAEFLVLIAHSARIPVQDPVVQAALAEPRLDPEKPARILREFCDAMDITRLDTYPVLRAHERATGEPYTWRYDPHWNETGHRIVADLLLNHLETGLDRQPDAEAGK